MVVRSWRKTKQEWTPMSHLHTWYKHQISARFWIPITLHMNISRFLTQWMFHRVQEHQKRSPDEEVMVFSFKTGQFTLLTLETVCGTPILGVLINNVTLVLCTHLKIRFLVFFSNWNHSNQITETQDMS